MKVARGFHNLRKAAGWAADGRPTDSRPADSGCVLTVGNDFRYGSKAEGTIHSLRAAGELHGFGVDQVDAFIVDGVRVSSTVIRERLEHGDCAGAARLLGRRYRMIGRVAHGERLGRTLGFPTANLRLLRRKSPLC